MYNVYHIQKVPEAIWDHTSVSETPVCPVLPLIIQSLINFQPVMSGWVESQYNFRSFWTSIWPWKPAYTLL